MLDKFDKEWLINQLIILVFGLGMSIIGYGMFKSRIFTVHHYRISIDLGAHHQLIGLVVMTISVTIFVFAVIGFYKKMKESIH